MADGTLKFDTRVDKGGFIKGVKDLSSQQMKLKNSIKQTNDELSKLEAELKKMSETPINSKDIDKLTAKAQQAEQELLRLLNAREQLESQSLTPELSTAFQDIGATPEQMYGSDPQWQKLTKEINASHVALEGYEAQLKQAKATEGTMADSPLGQQKQARYDKLSDQLDVYNRKLAEAEEKEQGVANKLKTIGKQGQKSFKSAGKSMDGINKGLGSFIKSFGRLAVMMLQFTLLFAAFQAIGTYMGGLLKTNSRFVASLASIKGSLMTAFQPIYQAVMPAINTFMAGLAKVIGYIAQFTSLLFGTTVKASQASAEALYNQAQAAEDVGKATKKASKATADFDQLHIITKNTTDSSGSGGSSSGAVAPTFDIEENAKVTAFYEKFKTLMEPTIEALGRLKQALVPVKDFAAQGLIDFYNDFLVPVGTWVFGEGLPRFIDAISNGLAKIDWGKINKALDDLWKALAPFAINIGEGLLWLWENVLVPLASWTISNILPAFLDILSGALTVVNNVIDALKPLGQWLWDNFLQPLASWTGGVIVTVLEKISDALKAIGDWIKNHQEAVQNIAIVIGSFAAAWGLVNLAIGVWNIVGVIATGVTTGFAGAVALLTSPITIVVLVIGALIAIIVLLAKNWDTVKETASKAWDKIKEVWGVVVDFFKKIWEGIVNVFSGVKDWFVKVFTSAKDGVKSAWTGITDFFGDVWTGIKDAFGDIAGWFGSVFSNAWQKVKDVFSTGGKVFDGIKDGILDGLKSVINALITGINRVVSIPFNGLNSALGAIRKLSILGAKPFSWLPTITVPQIPKLATGTVVPANYGEFQAILGDNKRAPEVVSPIPTMKQAFKEAMSEMGLGGKKGSIYLTVQLGTKTIYNEIIELHENNTTRTGKNALATT